MSLVNIRLAEDVDQKEWDAYVGSHSESSPYHLYAWKMATEQSYKWKGYYLIAEEDRQVRGVLPLVKMGLPLMAGQMVALPYCDLGSVLSDSQGIEERLVAEAIAIGKRNQVKCLEIRGQLTSKTLLSIDLPASTTTAKVRMLLDLPGSSEELFESFKSKLRSQIRKAEKNKLRFVWAEDDVSDFYTVFSENMRDLGSPVHSKLWLEAVIQGYGENARIGLVFSGTTPIGGAILLWCGQNVCVPWASTLRKYNRLAPNMILYWNMLRFAADNGFQVFDFGRSTPGEGTYKFKAQWGAQPKELRWMTIPIDCDTSPVIKGSSPHRKIVENLWCKLPVGVANFVGPKIRRFVSL